MRTRASNTVNKSTLVRKSRGTSPSKSARGRRPTVPVYIVSAASHGRADAWAAARAGTHRLRTPKALREAFNAAHRDAVWVAPNSASLAPLAAEAPSPDGEQRLLVLDEMKEVTHHLFSALFRYVVTTSNLLKLLEFDELIDVLTSPDRNNLFIGGAVDEDGEAVLLYRGNVEPLVVPLSWFVNESSPSRANPKAFSVDDYGQTIRLGTFEAAADAILYEFDPAFRKAAKRRALQEDPSLGAAIRRLRLQRGLSRRDFSGVTEKAIARLERNEVSRPRRKTLEAVASTLGVPVEELESY